MRSRTQIYLLSRLELTPAFIPRAVLIVLVLLSAALVSAVGFDPADRAVAAAQEQARKLGVKITTHVARAQDFDWGERAWDLIVLSYVGAREFTANVSRALRPGGMVVVEGFHRDATKTRPIGSAVVFDTNALLQLFAGFRVVQYEDTAAVDDFGLYDTRIVRLAAVKP